MTELSRTELTDRFGLTAPIVSAPMAGVAGGRLAAAVSAAGGLGMIGVGAATSPEWITAEAAVASSSGRPFGIGLMAWALEHHPEQLRAAIEAGPALVSVSFGPFAGHVDALHDAGITVATQVGDLETAHEAVDAGIDLIVARGAEAGGHGLSVVATLPLLQAVLEAFPDRPVLAAGGIVTGPGLAAVLAAGAVGAWCGTAFLACPEADNTTTARERICAAAGSETVATSVFDIAQQIPWPVGHPGRALANDFTDRWHGHEDDLATDSGAAGQLARAKQDGDYDVAYLYAGQGVGSVTSERFAAEVIADMSGEAAELLGA